MGIIDILFNPLFQFHNGTIKTQLDEIADTISTNFNSIMVQLKLIFPVVLLIVVIYFNSIMVQLKRLRRSDINRLNEFQFHNGTIKTHRHL